MTTEVTNPYTVLKIATDSGPLAQIWLAANVSNISKGSILQTSIAESAKEIAKVSGCTTTVSENNEYITLRTSGELLHGIVRVYAKQAGFLLSDIKDTLTKISSLFKINSRVSVTISRVNTIAKIDQLILEDVVTEKEVLMPRSLDFLNETTTSATLLGENDSMRRNVQGATPWDTSLEVGRRFNPDEDFANQSSALDLDFDIDDGYPIGTSDEGTRNTGLNSTLNNSHMKSNILGNLDDDFPLDDATNADWDLGITENDDHHDNDHERSVEIGRRVDEASVGEHTDFGFDLDIEKNNVEETQEMIETEPLIFERESAAQRRVRIQDPALVNTVEIVIDEDLELSKQQMERVTTDITVTETTKTSNTIASSNKRLWTEMIKDLGYLPSNITATLLSYQTFKKQKVSNEENSSHENIEQNPEMDISLGLDDQSFNNFDMIEDNFDDENILPQDNNTEEIPIDDIELQSQHIALEEQLLEQEIESDNQVKLTSGEVVSKEIVEMAEMIRSHVNEVPLNFSDILSAQHETEVPITKKEASKCFFEMLTLGTSGCIDMNQDDTFGDIAISTKTSLFEKYIAA